MITEQILKYFPLVLFYYEIKHCIVIISYIVIHCLIFFNYYHKINIFLCC